MAESLFECFPSDFRFVGRVGDEQGCVGEEVVGADIEREDESSLTFF
jgi:hypothetical protein